MRWKGGVTSTSLSLLLVGSCCVTPGPSRSTYEPPWVEPGQPLTMEGAAVVRSDDEHTLAVAVDANGDGKADHLFHLISDDTFPRVSESFQPAHIEFFGRELRIVSQPRKMVLTLALASEATRPVTEGMLSVRYSGYGLNHEMGPQVQKTSLR